MSQSALHNLTGVKVSLKIAEKELSMPQNQSQLLIQFSEAMFGLYESARRMKPPYTPNDFLSMLNNIGGKATADRLLAKDTPSSGFTELFIRGKENLKMSVEYLVLQHPWNILFTPEQLNIARKRLLDVECDLPPQPLDRTLFDHPLPEEIPVGIQLVEGAVHKIEINAYERNPAARAICLSHYGTACVVCGFNFGEIYGQLADGFIHVHHLRKLSEIRKDYVVDPIVDMRPVCPNCHAVIHLGGVTRSIEEVKELLAK